MNGKAKCKLLKQIRSEIAKNNDIAYVTSDCKYQGDCSGTCPKCEAEVRYLEEELRKRQNAGKAVAVAGIAAAMVVTASGCLPFSPTAGVPPMSEQGNSQTDATHQTTEEPTPPTGTEPTEGEITEFPGELIYGETQPTDPIYETTAGVPWPTDPIGDELMGDPTDPN